MKKAIKKLTSKIHEFKPFSYDPCSCHKACLPDCLRMVVRQPESRGRRYVFIAISDRNTPAKKYQAWEELGSTGDFVTGKNVYFRSEAIAKREIIKMYKAGRHLKRQYESAGCFGAY